MNRDTRNAGRWIALAAGVSLVATACSGDDGENGGDGDGEGALAGASLTVGSKEFTEQQVLGNMALLVLEHAGAEVSDQTGLTGTDTVRTALTSGEVDLYWEYTGTGWTSHLGHEASDASDDEQELFDQVAEEDLEQNEIAWFALAPFENTYRLATTTERSAELGVTTMSEYAELANQDPASASLCAATEFLTRADGWPGVEEAYGFDLPDSEIAEVDLGIVFTQVPSGDECKFGEVFSTDGRIPINDMVLIEDDQDFFVKYNLAMTARQEVLEEYPALEEVLTPLAEALDTETMQQLNAQVDSDGLPAPQVAEAWLEENGFLD